MSDSLGAFEECLDSALRDAHLFAEHNNHGVVKPEYVKAALLAQPTPESNPDRVVAIELGLFKTMRASAPELEAECTCNNCQKMCAVTAPAKILSPSNQLSLSLPFL